METAQESSIHTLKWFYVFKRFCSKILFFCVPSIVLLQFYSPKPIPHQNSFAYCIILVVYYWICISLWNMLSMQLGYRLASVSIIFLIDCLLLDDFICSKVALIIHGNMLLQVGFNKITEADTSSQSILLFDCST